jgi:hypothetical protein
MLLLEIKTLFTHAKYLFNKKNFFCVVVEFAIIYAHNLLDSQLETSDNKKSHIYSLSDSNEAIAICLLVVFFG